MCSYCFLTDVWTDLQNRSFLSLPVHYLDADKGCVIKGTIGMFHLTQQHNSENIVMKMQNIFEEWELSIEKTLAIITDNAENVTKALGIMFGKRKHIPVFAHTLNLLTTRVINDVVELKDILKKAKAIVGFFHHSTSGCDELREISTKTVTQDVSTRWNSTNETLSRFIELRSVKNEIVNRNTAAPPMLSAMEMEILQEVCEVLEPLASAAKGITSDKYVTPGVINEESSLYLRTPQEMDSTKSGLILQIDG